MIMNLNDKYKLIKNEFWLIRFMLLLTIIKGVYTFKKIIIKYLSLFWLNFYLKDENLLKINKQKSYSDN